MRRFISLAATTAIVLSITTGEAGAVKGSCDHRLEPDGFNHVTLSKGDGDVTIDVRWTWDFVSVWPDCDGTVNRAHIENSGTVSWYAHVVRRRDGQPLTIEIAPGENRNIQGGQLNQVGLRDYRDLEALTLTTVP